MQKENRENPTHTQPVKTHIEHASKLYVLTMIMTLVLGPRRKKGGLGLVVVLKWNCLRGKCIENALHANAPLSGVPGPVNLHLHLGTSRALIDIYSRGS